MNKSLPPFHLAVEVRDIAEARAFYGGLLGCPEGRSAEAWVDFNFFGHQLVCHLSDDYPGKRHESSSNPVDGHTVPVPHFGVVLEIAQWRSLAATLVDAAIEFVIEPYIRFQGEVGEQATMFFLDPSGNPLEFKAFQDVERQLFEAG
jgi:extradiol dioxygenase family protein